MPPIASRRLQSLCFAGSCPVVDCSFLLLPAPSWLGLSDARAEVAARRLDMHNSHGNRALPVDEWVPNITAGSKGGGFTTGPRAWPAEAEYTAGARVMSSRHPAPLRPSFARETTVAGAGGGLSDLQLALSGAFTGGASAEAASSVMRGTQRGVQKAALRDAALLSEALEERKHLQLRHASWLESSKPPRVHSSDAVAARPSVSHRGRRRPRYSHDLSVELGAPAAPSSVFREAMRKGGAGQRTNQLERSTEVRDVGCMAAVVQPSHDRTFGYRGHALGISDAALEKGLARKLKSRALRFELRIKSIAAALHALHRSPNARPGNQQVCGGGGRSAVCVCVCVCDFVAFVALPHQSPSALRSC